jgi:Asp-tRNA(Asn)/Glu-tRNA(Gln) amidotransferase C subunit
MEKEELKKLAQKIQLELKEKETIKYLKEFKQLEKPLSSFKKAKINPKINPMTRIDVGNLTLSELKKLEKTFSNPLISKKNLKDNSITVTKDNSVLFRKIS